MVETQLRDEQRVVADGVDDAVLSLASKAGLFAKLGVLLLAGKKLLIPIGIGIAVVFQRYRKKKANEVVA